MIYLPSESFKSETPKICFEIFYFVVKCIADSWIFDFGSGKKTVWNGHFHINPYLWNHSFTIFVYPSPVKTNLPQSCVWTFHCKWEKGSMCHILKRYCVTVLLLGNYNYWLASVLHFQFILHCNTQKLEFSERQWCPCRWHQCKGDESCKLRLCQ